ncbi:hypothetical protein BGX26_001705, partial [Mortierella sp. AD094]
VPAPEPAPAEAPAPTGSKAGIDVAASVDSKFVCKSGCKDSNDAKTVLSLRVNLEREFEPRLDHFYVQEVPRECEEKRGSLLGGVLKLVADLNVNANANASALRKKKKIRKTPLLYPNALCRSITEVTGHQTHQREETCGLQIPMLPLTNSTAAILPICNGRGVLAPYPASHN